MELLPLVTSPPRVHPWEPQFGSEHAPNDLNEERCPLVTLPTSGGRWYVVSQRSHCHNKSTSPQLHASQSTPPPIAVSADLEQLNPRGTRPPHPQALGTLAYRTPGPTARGRWGRRAHCNLAIRRRANRALAATASRAELRAARPRFVVPSFDRPQTFPLVPSNREAAPLVVPPSGGMRCGRTLSLGVGRIGHWRRPPKGGTTSGETSLRSTFF